MLKNQISCLLVLLCLLQQFISQAQVTKTDTLSIQQSLSYYRVSNPLFSPNNKKLVFVVNEPASIEKGSTSHIWLYTLSDKTIRQYSNSVKSEFSPKWKPKSEELAFLSTRNGSPQVFLLDNQGGEAIQLTHAKNGVKNFIWNPSGQSILYISEDTLTAGEQKRIDDKYDEEVLSQSTKPDVLYALDISSKQVRRLPGKNWKIEDMKWDPVNESVLLVTSSLPVQEIQLSTLTVFHWKDSSYTELNSPNNPFWNGIEISPDGKKFVYEGTRVDGPTAHDIYLQNMGEGKGLNLTEKTIDLPARSIRFYNTDTLAAIIQDGFHLVLKKISMKGVATGFGITQNVFSYDLNSDKQIAFVSASANQMQELWLQVPGRAAVQISHFNHHFDSVGLVKPETIHYKSFDGTDIEAIFFKPTHPVNASSLPMVVIIHGGPTGAFVDTYNAWAQLFLQKGYAVLMPNIRGSTGYGWDFLESNRYDWGGADFKDIMAGIDYVVKQRNVDNNKLAIAGWSYGGFMSEWAITQTQRFKAAISGAGLFNLISEFGTEDNAAYDYWHLGNPYEHPDVFAQHSALRFIKHAKTPTLIIQGTDDEVDPKGQSQELYRALRFYKVPTELVLYPREHHGFSEFKHNLDYYTRMLDWIAKYCPVDK